MTQWVPPPWPLLRCAKERTKAILSATLAISGKTPPSSMPVTLVGMAPTVERNSAGAVIFGSKVSTWVGPPPSQSQTTEVLRVGWPVAAAAAARARSRSGKARPPRPSAPTLRKSRRLLPSQLVPLRDASTLNISHSYLSRASSRRWPEGGTGLAAGGGPPVEGELTQGYALSRAASIEEMLSGEWVSGEWGRGKGG